MIGIPPSGTTEFVSFSVSFWAGLYSGAIYSLFTGVLVGFAVWGAQLIADNRREKRTHKEEIELLRQRVKHVNFQDKTFVVTSAELSCPRPSSEIMDILKDVPVDLWKTSSDEDTEFMTELKELRHGYMQFMEDARRLDSILRGFIRRYNDMRGAIAANDPANQGYFIGRTFGFDAPAIMPWLDSGSSESLEQSYGDAIKDSSIMNLIEPYKRSRASLNETQEKLGLRLKG